MPEEAQPAPQPQVTTGTQKHDWKKVGLTILIILVVAGLIVGAYWFLVLNKSSDNSDLTGPVPKVTTKTATNEKNETADWETVTDTDLGIEFKHPKGWTLESSKKSTASLATDDPNSWDLNNYKEVKVSSSDHSTSGSTGEGGENLKSGTSIKIFTYRNNLTYDSIEKAITLEPSSKDVETKTKVGGHDAVRIDFTLNTSSYATSVYVLNKGKVILINSNYLEGEQSKHESTFSKIIDSIKFL